MAIIVLFYAIVALMSLGMVTVGRWVSLAGVLLFCVNAWAFYEFLEALKR